MRAGPWAIWMLACGAAGMLAANFFAAGLAVAQQSPAAVSETAPSRKVELASADQKQALVFQLYAQGKYADALSPARECLAIRKKVLGEEHPDTASSLNHLGLLLQFTGDNAAARSYYEQALTIQKKVLGEEHPDTATSLNNLSFLFHSMGDYAAALGPARECLAIRRKVLGEEHPDTAKSLNDLGTLLENTGDYAAALPYYEQALTIQKKVIGEEHPNTATSLNNLGFLHNSMGDYAAARSYYEQALAIRKKVLGDDHPDTATSLNTLGGLLMDMSDYAAARLNFEQSLAIRKRVLGEEHPDTAISLDSVGKLLQSTGEYAAARPYYEQSLAIRKKVLGDEHPHTAQSLSNLGSLLESTGDYAAARPYYEQALAIERKVRGEEHPATATSLNRLGSLLQSTGDYTAARTYYERSLAIYRKVLGEEHPHTATALNNLGFLLASMGDYAAARPYYEQALVIKKKVVGEEHPDTAKSLNNLGIMLRSMGDPAAARPYYEQALAINRKVLGEDHPSTTQSLNNLGALLHSTGEYAAARPYYAQALAIHKKVLGEEHPDNALILGNLAILSAAVEDWPAAIDALVEANRIQQLSLENVFSTATEARMRAYLGTMSGGLDIFLSLPLAKFDREADGLTWVLRRKAIVYEALCRFRAVQWLARDDPEFAQRQSALLAAQKQLDDVTLRPSAAVAPEELAAKRAALQTQIAELEDQLQTALSAHLGKEWSLMTEIDSVRSQLPADAALVELVKYTPFNFQVAGKDVPSGAERYVAFVLHADAKRPVELVELGEAAAIDEAVTALGQHQKDVQRAGELADWPALETEYRGLAAPLHQRLFAPIAAKLNGVKHVFLSPDSQLHNLPFEALVDADGKYLAEQGYTFAYLASGRDLLRGQADQLGNGAYVFAAPNYDLQHEDRFRLAADRGGEPRGSQGEEPELLAAAGPLGTRSADVRGLRWKVLPSMAPEGVKAAQHLAEGPYGNVQSYSGDAALEEHFKRLVHPRLVVLVTHGFYLPDQPAGRAELFGDDPTTRSAFAQGAGLARLRAQENPLYRSGVVLAGANTLDDPVPDGVSVEDGWLTAEEISQLDLRGTDLVVLSACNTGRGQVATGDAVAGLRSAFLFAGTQTLVGSLYEVPDEQTRQLMQSFYAGLRERRGKLQSLNAARIELIAQLRKQQGAAHPFFWASFVLVGEP